jgi:hypothetical protein
MLFDLSKNRLTKFVFCITFLLISAIVHGADSEPVDFIFANENGAQTVRVETKNVKKGEQNLSPEGIAYFTPGVVANSEIALSEGELIPLKDHNSKTLGFFTSARYIKYFRTYHDAKITAINGLATGAAMFLGQVVANHFEFPELTQLASVPVAMALAFAWRYKYNDIMVFFNKHSLTPSQYLRARQLSLENPNSPELKNAGGIEQLAKMYLLSATLTAAATLGSDTGTLMDFLRTSVAYTFTTTYELIISQRRNAKTERDPSNKESYYLNAHLASIGASFIDNFLMKMSSNGVPGTTLAIYIFAGGLNLYHFGGQALEHFRQPKFQCAGLF